MCNVNNKKIRYNLRHYLAGALPARLGDEMSGQTILLIGMAGNSVKLGSTRLAGLTISAAVGGPLLGALLDRSRQPGKVLASAIVLYALGLALIVATLGNVPVFASVGVALCAGLCMPAISGGWSSRLKSFVADEYMTRASAIDATTFNVAGLAGPALAGLITAWMGVSWAAVVLITLLVVALPMAWRLPPRTDSRLHVLSFVQTIQAGFKIILNNRRLLRITLVSVVSYLGIGMLWVIVPLVGAKLLGNPGYGGVLMSVLSVSALVATVAYAKWPTQYSPDRVAFASTVILGLAMLALAFATNYAWAIIAMLVAGLADGPQLAAIFAVRNREAPEHARSQVFTTGASLKITAAAIGTAVAGYTAGYSLEWTIAGACAVQFAAMVLFMVLSKLPRV